MQINAITVLSSLYWSLHLTLATDQSVYLKCDTVEEYTDAQLVCKLLVSQRHDYFSSQYPRKLIWTTTDGSSVNCKFETEKCKSSSPSSFTATVNDYFKSSILTLINVSRKHSAWTCTVDYDRFEVQDACTLQFFASRATTATFAEIYTAEKGKESASSDNCALPAIGVGVAAAVVIIALIITIVCILRRRKEYFVRKAASVPPVTTYVTPSDGYVRSNEGYITPSDGYVRPDEGYVTPSDGYVRPDEGYVTPSDGYARPDGGYVTPHVGYLRSTEDDVTSNDGYLTLIEDDVTPNDGSCISNEAYSPLNDDYTTPDNKYDSINYKEEDACVTRI